MGHGQSGPIFSPSIVVEIRLSYKEAIGGARTGGGGEGVGTVGEGDQLVHSLPLLQYQRARTGNGVLVFVPKVSGACISTLRS